MFGARIKLRPTKHTVRAWSDGIANGGALHDVRDSVRVGRGGHTRMIALTAFLLTFGFGLVAGAPLVAFARIAYRAERRALEALHPSAWELR